MRNEPNPDRGAGNGAMSLMKRLVERSIRTSIRNKIIAITVIACAAALGIAGIGLGVYELISIRAATTRNMVALAKVLGSNCSAAAAFRDRDAARDVISAVDGDPGVRSVGVYMADGSVLSAYPHMPTESPMQKVIGQGTKVTIKGLHVWVEETIYLDREAVAVLHLHGYMHEILPRFIQYAIVMMSVVLISIAASVFLTDRLQKGISGPIQRLSSVAATVSKNRDYTIRAKQTTADEVGLLVSGFNTMLGEIERRDRELQQAHDTLEHRVQRRTAELLKAKDAAEEAARAKSEFLANISHELRTPMHAVLSFASFGITKGPGAGPEKTLDYFTKIHTAGGRLLGLLNDLLDLAKLEAGRMTMDFAPADANVLLANTVDEFRSLTSDRNIEITLDTTIDRPFMMDSGRIMQVVRNIMGNAVKFSPPGGVIRVTASMSDRGLLVTVEDQGVGVPDDELELIFGKFMQSRKTKTGAGGTGLGLAICQEIVGAHGGRIWAEPGRAKGALFCIEIPHRGDLAAPGPADHAGAYSGDSASIGPADNAATSSASDVAGYERVA